MHGTFHAWCGGQEALDSVQWDTQLVGTWVTLSCVYLRHKRTDTRAAVAQLPSAESTGCSLWCCLTTDVQTPLFLRLKARKAGWQRLEITAKLSWFASANTLFHCHINKRHQWLIWLTELRAALNSCILWTSVLFYTCAPVTKKLYSKGWDKW